MAVSRFVKVTHFGSVALNAGLVSSAFTLDQIYPD